MIVRFLAALRAGDLAPDGLGSPVLRRAGSHQDLLPLLPTG